MQERLFSFCRCGRIERRHIIEPSLEGALQEGLFIEDYIRSFIVKHQTLYSEQELAARIDNTRKTIGQKRKNRASRGPLRHPSQF